MEVTHWHSTIQNLCCQKEEFAFLRRGDEDFKFFMTAFLTGIACANFPKNVYEQPNQE